MTVTESRQDPEGLTLSFVAEFDAPVERVWELWADSRKLERWWGPPGYPASFTTYDFVEGGEALYYMSTPDGQRTPDAWWTLTTIDAPNRLEFDDGFIDENGNKDQQLGAAHAVVTLEPHGSGTRMTVTNHFASREQFDTLIGMGMEEGMREAMGQMDALLAEGA